MPLEFIKSDIDFVRGIIGRAVTVYAPKTSSCLICVASGYYDPVSDDSYFVTCPQCAGAFYLNTIDATDIEARVHWVSNEGITATPGGKYFLGDAHITVDPCYLELLQSANNEAGKVVVDGQDMQIVRINPMGAPEINRVRAVLKSMGSRRNTD